MSDPTPISDAIARARSAMAQNAPTPDQMAAELAADEQKARARALEVAGALITAEDVSDIIYGRLRPEPPLLTAQAFLRGPCALLILHGDMGLGKTVAGAWCIAERGGQFISAVEMAAVFTSRLPEDRARVNAIKNCQVLQIDDLCDEEWPNRLRPWLIFTLNHRLSRGLKTIWTSNKSADFIKKRYPDPKLWDRVKQSVTDEGFTGKSLRRSAGKGPDLRKPK